MPRAASVKVRSSSIARHREYGISAKNRRGWLDRHRGRATNAFGLAHGAALLRRATI